MPLCPDGSLLRHMSKHMPTETLVERAPKSLKKKYFTVKSLLFKDLKNTHSAKSLISKDRSTGGIPNQDSLVDLEAPYSACFVMFKSTPTQARVTNSDDPPYETSGSGMPLVGIRPSTTLTLINACRTIMLVMPTARKRPKLS